MPLFEKWAPTIITASNAFVIYGIVVMKASVTITRTNATPTIRKAALRNKKKNTFCITFLTLSPPAGPDYIRFSIFISTINTSF